MQIDFHYYAIYALSRAAAFNPTEAHIIAYSSQYVDDSLYDFYPGLEPWQPIMTAHMGIRTWEKRLQNNVYLPFHFIPSGEGEGKEKLITRPASKPAEAILNAALEMKGSPLFLIRLGIALHPYADTFSHQGFTGNRSKFNRVNDLQAINENRFWESAQVRWYFHSESPAKLLPKIGHGEAGKYPDIPYLEWEYRGSAGKRVFVSNPQRFLQAAEAIYAHLGELNPHRKSIPWKNLKPKLKNQFETRGSLHRRVKAWKRAIRNGTFFSWSESEIPGTRYNKHRWRDAAIKPKLSEDGLWVRRPTFDKSHWVRWNQAAREHRQLFLSLEETCELRES